MLIFKYLGGYDEPRTPEETTRTEADPLVPGRPNHFTYGTTNEEDPDLDSCGSLEDLYEGKICAICYDEQRNCFFVPCGHCATCYECAQRIMDADNKVCPICRRKDNNFTALKKNAAMVCDKCEKKLSKVIVPDKWKEGASNTTEGGGRKINENKLLSKKNRKKLPSLWVFTLSDSTFFIIVRGGPHMEVEQLSALFASNKSTKMANTVTPVHIRKEFVPCAASKLSIQSSTSKAMFDIVQLVKAVVFFVGA
ncbi:RING/U-box superfamily protein [Thalictrum thalictroides]|uniref:RING/U-box superfamily protein n=1 Tax=Thalictrum thalictroides TaxID=46969 RepID=A0A7J6WEZ9_THATH|nr:RING/U-box superfamily protein [Thalictrum thalictroides]